MLMVSKIVHMINLLWLFKMTCKYNTIYLPKTEDSLLCKLVTKIIVGDLFDATKQLKI